MADEQNYQLKMTKASLLKKGDLYNDPVDRMTWHTILSDATVMRGEDFLGCLVQFNTHSEWMNTEAHCTIMRPIKE